MARTFIDQGETDAIHFGAFRYHLGDDLEEYERLETVFDHAPESARNETLKTVLMRSSDLEAGTEKWNQWLETLPNDDRRDVIVMSVRDLAASNPAMAVAQATTLADADRPSAFHGIAKQWADADSYATSEWVASLEPGLERDHAALALVESISKAEPDSAWQWAQTIQVPEQRQRAMHSALRHFGEAAADVVAVTDLDSAERTALNAWLNTQSSHSH